MSTIKNLNWSTIKASWHDFFPDEPPAELGLSDKQLSGPQQITEATGYDGRHYLIYETRSGNFRVMHTDVFCDGSAQYKVDIVRCTSRHVAITRANNLHHNHIRDVMSALSVWVAQEQ